MAKQMDTPTSSKSKPPNSVSEDVRHDYEHLARLPIYATSEMMSLVMSVVDMDAALLIAMLLARRSKIEPYVSVLMR